MDERIFITKAILNCGNGHDIEFDLGTYKFRDDAEAHAQYIYDKYPNYHSKRFPNDWILENGDTYLELNVQGYRVDYEFIPETMAGFDFKRRFE